MGIQIFPGGHGPLALRKDAFFCSFHPGLRLASTTFLHPVLFCFLPLFPFSLDSPCLPLDRCSLRPRRAGLFMAVEVSIVPWRCGGAGGTPGLHLLPWRVIPADGAFPPWATGDSPYPSNVDFWFSGFGDPRHLILHCVPADDFFGDDVK